MIDELGPRMFPPQFGPLLNRSGIVDELIELLHSLPILHEREKKPRIDKQRRALRDPRIDRNRRQPVHERSGLTSGQLLP